MEELAEKPAHVDELGNKFWLDRTTTMYGLSKGLKDVQVLLVERRDGYRTRLVTEGNPPRPIFEATSIEAVGVHLDVLAFVSQFQNQPAETSDENDG